MSSSSFVSSAGTAPTGGLSTSIAELLTESFALIESGLPPAFRALADSLARQRIRIEVDGEVLEVFVDAAALRVASSDFALATARIATDSTTILDVLDARTSLRDAVLNGRLRVITELASVGVLHDALLTYTHAAVRCPGFPELMERLKSRAAGSLPAESSQS